MNQTRQYSQKPRAIRERTRMTDIETKRRKDRARLLVRVRAGASAGTVTSIFGSKNAKVPGQSGSMYQKLAQYGVRTAF